MTSHGDASDVDEVALTWFTQLRGIRVPPPEFERWLAASPSHQAAYRRVESIWSSLDEVGSRAAQRDANALAPYLVSIDRSRRRRAGRLKLGATAVVVAGLMATVTWFERPHLLQDLAADAVSARAERQQIALPDGSSALLDADSAVSWTFSDRARHVSVIRGGAYFSVAKTGTPFVVEANGGQVAVVGTQFDVRIGERENIVTVAEGSVAITPPGRTEATLLGSGQQLRFRDGFVSPVATVNLAEAMSWHQGRLVFYKARLGDVVAELRRYKRGRIAVLNPALEERRISGSFSLDDPDAALGSLQTIVGFSLTNIGSRLAVIR